MKFTKLVLAAAFVALTAPAMAQVDAKVTGRVHFDTRTFDSDLVKSADRDSVSVGDNFEVRRARIGINGSINKQINYELVGNAVGGTTNFIDTAFVNYGFNQAAQLRTGRFKQPFSLEEQTSSNNIGFMERSYGNQLVPGKRLGVMLHGEPGAGIVYGLSAFQGDFTESSSDNTLGAQYAARAAVNLGQLIARPNTVLHVGVARTGGSSQMVPTTSGNTVDAPSTTTRGTIVAMRSEARGMSNIYRAQIGGDKIDTAAYGATANNAVTVNRTMDGIELALAHGPFKIQAENFDSKYSASAKTYNYVTGATSCVTAACVATQDVRVQAKYVEALYNITGEDFAKSYKSGAFGGITPSSVFMKDYGGVVGNGTGAWQVGVRVSEYTAAGSNSVDGAVTGNRTQNATGAQTVTYGVNWILNSNARIMANYATTKFDTAIAPLDTTDMGTTTKENVFSIRTQINF